MTTVNVKLYRITLDNTVSWKKTEEEFLVEQAPWKKAGFKLTTWDSDNSYQSMIDEVMPYVCDSDRVMELMLLGIKVKMESDLIVPVNIGEDLKQWSNKVEHIMTQPGNEYNTKCEVHMPGQALSMYNDVLLQEDCCTDQLKAILAQGFRIIAACPQPDQRRPDYILGRYNPDRVSE